MEMIAEYNGRRVYVASVSKDKKYVLASYDDSASQKLFKIEIEELSEISIMLQAEIHRIGF